MSFYINKVVEEFNSKFIIFEEEDIVDGFKADDLRSFMKNKLEEAYEQGKNDTLHTIRKSRKKHNELCKRDNKVLSIIKNYYDETDKYPSFRLLANLYGSTVRNVEVSVHKLRSLGYLEKTKKIELNKLYDSSK